MNNTKQTLLSGLFLILFTSGAILYAQNPAELLVEAESFTNKGGWKVDQQFVHEMGSPYLLAHGKGIPVEDAATQVVLDQTGDYYLWVRTKDWVPEHPDTPGTFKISFNGETLDMIFGVNEDWQWVDAGKITLNSTTQEIKLHDLTGFEGRCDAIFLTTDAEYTPPSDNEVQKTWRRDLAGLPEIPPTAGSFDVVVVGGGIAGTAAAIAAARGGCSVALIQDRPKLGGNASEEIRVHTLGMQGSKIVSEINYSGTSGTEYAVEMSERRHAVVEAEPNINLFLSTRAYSVNMSENIIVSVDAKHIETGIEQRFLGDIFIDCTGDGWIGYWSGARIMMGREARSEFEESIAPETRDTMMMGSTIWWNSIEDTADYEYPEVPWAMDVSKDYYEVHGDWYWEYGIGMDPFENTEHIRDHLFRAIYGSFYNLKQLPEHSKRKLNFMAYLIGKRESRRIVGDHILTEDDVRNAYPFEDGVVTEKRSIDLHLPKSETYDFLTRAYFWSIPQYTIPFRSLYSADIDNLMMAGRCLSATHVGLGSPRVMNTGGQMGVATGYAASLCKKYDTNPRGIYTTHIKELQDSVDIHVIDTVPPDDAILILDNLDANHIEITGEWQSSTYSSGYYAQDYMHDQNKDKGSKWIRYTPELEAEGTYKIYCIYTEGTNRASNTPFRIEWNGYDTTLLVDQTSNGGYWRELGSFDIDPAYDFSITIENEGTDGYVIADAISIVSAADTGSNNTAVHDLVTGEIMYVSNSPGFAHVHCFLEANNNIVLEIYNTDGRLMNILAKGPYSQGKHIFTWNCEQAGIYIARLRTEKGWHSKKFVVSGR